MTSRTALLTLLAVGASVLLAPPGVAHATVDPFAAKTTILYTGGAPGCYRIPAIVRTKDGSLLAFAERRVNSCEDKSNIQLVARRLPTGTSTWQAQRTVLRGTDSDPTAPATRGNPAPVVYRKLPGAPATTVPDGRIVLLSVYNWVNPATPDVTHNGARTPYVQYSDDDGLTWSQARSLYDQIDDPAWGHYATGPMHAIQLQRGPNAGRLVVAVNYGAAGDASGAMIVYSDDGGSTWQKGARREYPDSANLTPQEISLVELSNGDVYAWARQNWFSDVPSGAEGDVNVRPHRLSAISRDGGQTFTSAGFQAVQGFETPRVESSALRLRSTGEGDGYNRILTSAPSVNNSRSRMTIRSSFDEGQTWQRVDTHTSNSTDEGVQVWGTDNRTVSKDECACYAGYSDMVELTSGEVGLVYERGASGYHEEIAFVRLNNADLSTPPSTPDSAGGAALVFDGATLSSAGRFGGGMNFNGATGRVQLPYRTTPVLGPGDFTVSVWFRYGASTADQAILWAYGQNDQPQVWIRAEPGDNRIRATVRPVGAAAGTSVSSAKAYSDGAWHHLVLRREAGTIALIIDGTQVGSATGVAGAVNGADPAPIYLGQRMDGAHRLDGRLDEVRVYNRALTGDELTRLRQSNATDIAGLTARLPLDTVQQP